MPRPTSLAIVSWLLIVLGALGAVSAVWSYHNLANNPQVTALMARSPVSPDVQQAVGILGSLINIVAGVLMLRRMAAGRLLYVVWGAISLVFGVWASPIKTLILPSILVYAVIVFVLYRRPVSAWLAARALP
jgi:hypothetical protein